MFVVFEHESVWCLEFIISGLWFQDDEDQDDDDDDSSDTDDDDDNDDDFDMETLVEVLENNNGAGNREELNSPTEEEVLMFVLS